MNRTSQPSQLGTTRMGVTVRKGRRAGPGRDGPTIAGRVAVVRRSFAKGVGPGVEDGYHLCAVSVVRCIAGEWCPAGRPGSRSGGEPPGRERLVHGLVRQGLVEVVDDRSSGRAKLVRPTEAGQASVDVALRTFADLEARLGARIGPSRLANLRSALEADLGD